MTKSDTFYLCDALTYDHRIDSPTMAVLDMEVLDMTNLNTIGYSIVIEQGQATLHGSPEARALLVASQLENVFLMTTDYPDLRKYVAYHFWSKDMLVAAVQEAIAETILNKAYDVRFLDIFEFIITNWVLSAKEDAEQAKRDSAEYKEQAERVYQ